MRVTIVNEAVNSVWFPDDFSFGLKNSKTLSGPNIIKNLQIHCTINELLSTIIVLVWLLVYTAPLSSTECFSISLAHAFLVCFFLVSASSCTLHYLSSTNTEHRTQTQLATNYCSLTVYSLSDCINSYFQHLALPECFVWKQWLFFLPCTLSRYKR